VCLWTFGLRNQVPCHQLLASFPLVITSLQVHDTANGQFLWKELLQIEADLHKFASKKQRKDEGG